MEELLSQLNTYLQGAPLLALPAAFLAGVLTSFTPCIYPLIPITVGIIGAKSSQTRKRGFILSLMYVLGLALVYAALGAFAALSGKLFGQISTNMWTFLLVGNLFFLFGLSMLDVFSLELTFLQKWSPSAKGTGLLTALLFGGVSALIAGPCTTPVLGTLLAFVASRQNVMLGFTMLFLFAFGMGFLLIIVGTFTGLLSTIPRSGAWMITIKKAFGFLMIGLGEYFILKAGQLMF
ncbi:MAG: sulfite exporter TauE/SafE family protein [Deltaproteobacteria bacterium]|nr:sulfite exporter TauE/SafE family protein [Deltaproteobacteria bacterium]